MYVAIAALQLEDRIADELTGPVISHLSAARDPVDGNIALAARQQEALIGAAAEREHMRMLEEQERVADFVVVPRCY